MTYKFDVVSDLHIDAWAHTTQLHEPTRRLWEGEPYQSRVLHIDWRFYKNPGSWALVIAGDTSNSILSLAMVVEQAAQEYDQVIIVDGNHEHYHGDSTVEDNMIILSNALQPLPNATYLDGTRTLRLGDTVFVGCTGWYDWLAHTDRGIPEYLAKKAWIQASNDARYPDFGSFKDPDKLANIQAVQLAEHVRTASNDDTVKNIVVVTHMSPRSDLMQWKEGDVFWNALTPSYVNTKLLQVLEADTGKKIRHWIYGHTHEQKTTTIDDIVYTNNARGYPRENGPLKLVQLEI